MDIQDKEQERDIDFPIDDHEDHGISTYDDDEALRKKIAKMGLKI